MKSDCYPVTALPHTSVLFRDYMDGLASPPALAAAPVPESFYSPLRQGKAWSQHAPELDPAQRAAITELLRKQNRQFGAGPDVAANLDRLAEGASAVVTGQQVGLFGGPLLTLFKAATAIRLAEQTSRAGRPHVPIFWLASEDHDFDEIRAATFLDSARRSLTTLRLPTNPAPGRPVGDLPVGNSVQPLLEDLRRCLGDSSIADLLAELYSPDATFATAFAGFLSRVFAGHGLIVIDAASRPFHALARNTLRAAIERADELHAALLVRTGQLEDAGYHAQVMVGGSSSLLFLVDPTTGAREALKKAPGGAWSAGGKSYPTPDLLAILDAEPERISPNALLRPVLQDTLLPTAAYVGGPAEIAYFAQSSVLYQAILGRVTPILPRISATLVEPHVARILERHALTLPEVFTTPDALAQRLGAQAIPVDAKRKLAHAGNALEAELKPLVEWMHAQDAGLGHAADVAASKMLYQMNRLRRLSAQFSLQRDESLRRHADALCRNLFPNGNLQERILAGAGFLASNSSLVDLLTGDSFPDCLGHSALFL